MKLKVPFDRVVLLLFHNQHKMCSSLMRVQERYESPRFRGLVFTHEQYFDWYATKFGEFDYWSEVLGFNFPGRATTPFYDGRFDPLWKKEKQVLRLLKPYYDAWGEDFYVIAALATDERSISHETAHALFYSVPWYRREVKKLVKEWLPRSTILVRRLKERGYCNAVLTDEINAFVATSSPRSYFCPGSMLPLRKELRKLFRKAKKEAKR